MTGYDFQPEAVPLDLREEEIKIVKVRHVSLNAAYILSDLLDRRSQLPATAAGYEDIGAFVYKLLRGGEADATIATSNECNLSFKLAHMILLRSHFLAASSRCWLPSMTIADPGEQVVRSE